MSFVSHQQTMNSEVLWDEYDPYNINNHIDFDKHALYFAIFHTNSDKITQVKKSLDKFMEPFKHYQWFNEAPEIMIEERNSQLYIFGELDYGNNIEDEWLLTALLHEFSVHSDDTYIFLRDSHDGEFLLVEFAESIPEWMSPESCTNRIVLSLGSIFLVHQVNEGRAQTMSESVEKINEGNFDFDRLLTNILKEKLDPIKEHYFLQNMFDTQLTLPEIVIKYIYLHPHIIGKSISEFCKEANSLKPDSLEAQDETLGDEHCIAVGVPAIAITLLKHISSTNKLYSELKFETLLQRVLVNSFKKLTRNAEECCKLDYIPDISRNCVQQALLQEGIIKKHVEEDASIFEIKPEDNTDNEPIQSLMDKLSDFFMDTEAGPEGIENKGKEDKEAGEKDIIIDEDDFFEFFLSNELKLKYEEIQEFRSSQTETKKGRKRNVEEYNDESDYKSYSSDDPEDEENFSDFNEMDESIKGILGNSQEGDHENYTLDNFLHSIKAGFGPGNSILNNLPKTL